MFHIPQAFFDALQQRISSGSTKKRLPNSTTGKKLAYTLKALCIPLKAGKSPHEADTPLLFLAALGTEGSAKQEPQPVLPVGL